MEEPLKNCPACGQQIKEGAVKCRFCKSFLDKNIHSAQTSSNAIASMVLGCFGFFCWGIPALLAIIFGSIALKEIQKSHGKIEGKDMAIAGITVGSVFLIIHLLIFMLWGGFLMFALLMGAFK